MATPKPSPASLPSSARVVRMSDIDYLRFKSVFGNLMAAQLAAHVTDRQLVACNQQLTALQQEAAERAEDISQAQLAVTNEFRRLQGLYPDVHTSGVTYAYNDQDCALTPTNVPVDSSPRPAGLYDILNPPPPPPASSNIPPPPDQDEREPVLDAPDAVDSHNPSPDPDASAPAAEPTRPGLDLPRPYPVLARPDGDTGSGGVAG